VRRAVHLAHSAGTERPDDLIEAKPGSDSKAHAFAVGTHSSVGAGSRKVVVLVPIDANGQSAAPALTTTTIRRAMRWPGGEAVSGRSASPLFLGHALAE